jgi:UDP-N-acetylglucosamine--N-acetylmuramyl-(pentapeptide) pyrophosphoryl-undecaprenol N-acetylglucosamine transferase
MRIVVTGGGTMGHITPLLEIIKEFKSRGINRITYFGNKLGLENSIAEREEIPFVHIESQNTEGLGKIKNTATFILKNILGIKQAIKYLDTIKPDLVVATGGFVSAPVLAAARYLNIPYVIHEQNRVVGKVNKLFMKGSSEVFYTFEGTKGGQEKRLGMTVGNPVKNFGFEMLGEKIVFLGGSGGSEEINELALEYARQNKQEKILLQTGIKRKDRINKIIEEEKLENIETLGFSKIENIYKQSKVVIARSGSTTLSELIENEIPIITIPFEQSADNHQVENAKFIQEMGYGRYLSGKGKKEIKETIDWIMERKERIKGEMKDKKKRNIVEKIVARCLEITNKRF